MINVHRGSDSASKLAIFWEVPPILAKGGREVELHSTQRWERSGGEKKTTLCIYAAAANTTQAGTLKKRVEEICKNKVSDEFIRMFIKWVVV